jgi:hypothetical protein
VQGAGLYALMSSLEIPLYGAGWNNFAYPVQGTRPVDEASCFIEGYYSTVSGYVITDTVDSWKVYGRGAPDWVNDLERLRFGQGYWIRVIAPATLYIQGSSTAGIATVASVRVPPATYYGLVPTNLGVLPEPGMTRWLASSDPDEGVAIA